jgi:hypothetical protein
MEASLIPRMIVLIVSTVIVMAAAVAAAATIGFVFNTLASTIEVPTYSDKISCYWS